MDAFVDSLEDGTAGGARACKLYKNCLDCCYEVLCWPEPAYVTRARAGDTPVRVREEDQVGSPVEKEDFEVIF